MVFLTFDFFLFYANHFSVEMECMFELLDTWEFFKMSSSWLLSLSGIAHTLLSSLYLSFWKCAFQFPQIMALGIWFDNVIWICILLFFLLLQGCDKLRWDNFSFYRLHTFPFAESQIAGIDLRADELCAINKVSEMIWELIVFSVGFVNLFQLKL